MNKPELTAERLREMLHYDPETGVFTRLACRTKYGTTATKRNLTGKEAGWVASNSKNPDYKERRISVDHWVYPAHRLAWLYVHGKWPDGNIDHIDGNPLNNRVSNLRDVTQSVNLQNQRRARSDSQSGLLGASPIEKGRWVATIKVDGRKRHLGTFETPEEAHQVYLAAKRKLHEGCTI